MLPDRQKPSAGRAGRHGSLVSFSSWEFMPHGVGCKLPEWGHFSAAQVTAGCAEAWGDNYGSMDDAWDAWVQPTRMSQSQLTVRVVQHSSGDCWLQLLQANFFPVPAAAPCLQGYLVDLLTTSVAKITSTQAETR